MRFTTTPLPTGLFRILLIAALHLLLMAPGSEGDKSFILVRFEQVEGAPLAATDVGSRFNIDLIGNAFSTSISPYYLFSSTIIASFDQLLHGSVSGVKWAKLQDSRLRVKREVGFNDEQWPNMWYLNEDVYPETARMNVFEAWELGYTGRGVSVAIVDDGLEWNHVDLIDNYDPSASYDFNDMDDDPSPRQSIENQHGTRCAGVVAAKANNSFCSVGIAFNARVGGIRLLDGIITDAHESMALSFGVNDSRIDIYSASWGPSDNGATVDGPNMGAMRALEMGVKLGRNGRGNLYVWATGNGGRSFDHCSCDGYVSSPYTIAVGSMTEKGQFPMYAERCASIMTTTYSSGNDVLEERSIITTDLGSECTAHHTGTSVSAPMFAGIVALGLEANPDLCWRQVQYLTALSSRSLPNMINPFTDDRTWWRNGAGLLVSDSFGYGMVDAGLFVKFAKAWRGWKLPKRKACVLTPRKQFSNTHFVPIRNQTITNFEICTDGCKNSPARITSLEHVSLVLTVQSLPTNPAQRGNLEVLIKSPSGETTPLLIRRKSDQDTRNGFVLWPFTSVLHWLEDPKGCWKITIKNHSANGTFLLKYLEIILHGVDFMP